MPLTVAHALVEFAARLGIRRLYGMPGAHILPVYDALHGTALESILAKHEQGAAFMALGEARLTGKPAGCITTAGPGATNLATPLASAFVDRVPVLALCGETSTTFFGRGGLQEASGEGDAIDLVRLLAPITRYVRRIERLDYLPQALFEAALALCGPEPGPAALIVPFNVQRETTENDPFRRFSLPFCPALPPNENDIRRMAETLLAARRPVILAGAGCLAAGLGERLSALAHRLSAPLATTLKAKGVLDENDPLAVGCLGVTSNGVARAVVEAADCLLILGARIGERTSYLWDERLFAGKSLLQIDADARQIGRNFVPSHAIVADLGLAIAALLAALPTTAPIRPLPAKASPPLGEHFSVIAHFLTRLRRLPALQVFDDNIILAQSLFMASPTHRYFPNTGISALGHAIPAALGARLANAIPTFAIVGDGGFQMCGFELMTAINHGIPINVLLINNGSLGLIRKNQYQHYGGRLIACDFANPDYARLAESFAFRHFRLDGEASVDAFFAEADLHDGFNLIELPWDKDVFPSYRVER